MNRFSKNIDYRSLSIKDLLEARDAYHLHLLRLDNVVGTAIGYYRFHPSDPAAKGKEAGPAGSFDKEKHLSQSIVTAYSHPAILVFVDRSVRRDKMAKTPEQYIPPRLYLRDGRVIPTCTLVAKKEERAVPAPRMARYPSRLMGGGFPCLLDRQGQKRVGTIGCLVTDGNLVYALTNRHVAGEKGEDVFTQVGKGKVKIGTSSGKSVGRIPFSDAYLGWSGYRAIANIDAGLISLENVSQWTAQIFGLGIMGEPVDLNTETMSLDLIGCPVIAHGGASGIMRGEIMALFYRYRSIGGVDYIADFVISPNKEAGGDLTRPGDSGTIWFYDANADRQPTRKGRAARDKESDHPSQPQPLAIQWGGQVFGGADAAKTVSFALASNLATICRLLNIEPVRDWDIGLPEYWGKLGHFAIAQMAISLLTTRQLKTLMEANLSRITYPLDVFVSSAVPAYANASFIPLADVPDLVWKSRSRLKRSGENGNHYLNLDLRGRGTFNNKYLKTLWNEDNSRFTPEYFTRFYDSIPEENDHERRGALPFRVWQIYNDMTEALSEGGSDRAVRFVAMAGVLAHYMADACMPLHNTKYHHGYSEAPDEQKKVHNYVDNNILSIQQGSLLNDAFSAIDRDRSFLTVEGGQAWGQRTMDLLVYTYDQLKPTRIINAFNETIDLHWRSRYSYMIEKVGEPLCECIAEGTFRLAEIWENAWQEGGGDSVPNSQLVAVPEQDLSGLYLDKEGFVPCRLLKDLTVADSGRLVLQPSNDD
ncbi:MAG: hypothetical protein AMJ75_01050 [Phycisphaerae bacterium SM1_79]|nr:MAG: hypothetical protein AMJ75_01050 [Phycisphaerae bacterium SM1_79]